MEAAEVDSKKVFEIPKAKLGMKEIIAQSKDVVSIFAEIKKVEEKKESIEEEEEPALRLYSEQEVQEAWADYLANANLPLGQLYTALRTAVLQYKSDSYTAVFSFPSETQVIYFNEVRGEVAAFFRNKNLPGLKLETYVQKEDERVISMLTDGQKFEVWRKENPALEDLYRLFQLRVE